MTAKQQAEIQELLAHYGRYPGMSATSWEFPNGSIHFHATYRVPQDVSDLDGTFPESQTHWLKP